jgi:predicted enzyme related to lactoylglutathione lyase
MSPDVDASQAFYGAVFGWDATEQHDDDGNRIYVLFELDGKTVAGLGGQGPGMEGMPPMWNSYVAVDDVAAAVDRAIAAGGTVVAPPMQVMDAGEMAVIADPTGAVISLWKAGQHIGAGVCNEPNTWSWTELLTRDVDTARAFYVAVFGWDVEDQDMGPMGTYHVVRGGEHGGWAGMMAMPAEMPDMVPNHWMVYFTVADVDATLAAVAGNGGSVAQGPMDIPGVGRVATAHDPAGGSFSLMQPAN